MASPAYGSLGGLLPLDADTASHARLLDRIAPALDDADVTAVNLETPLVEDPWFDPLKPRPDTFHPTKEYAFASAPPSSQALADVGVDVVDGGNNHVFDALDAGVESTRSALAAAGLTPGRGSFGAGRTVDEAWSPAFFDADGERVGFVGCTTITGEEHWLSYVATVRRRLGHGRVAPAHGGAAECRTGRLARAVRSAARRSDVVVAIVHGGYEYSRTASGNVQELSQVARHAGADLVINHHPHVVGGLTQKAGGLVAATMGNLLFDQTIWPTFDSYLLQVVVRRGRVVGAWTEPLRSEDFLPTPVHGEDADWASRGIAVRSVGEWVVEDGSMWWDPTGHGTSSTVGTVAGDLTRIRQGCAAGAGRELLWTGDFDTQAVGSDVPAPLWNVVEDDPYRHVSPDGGRGEGQGVLLYRADRNDSDVVLNPSHRVLVHDRDRLTLLVDHRAVSGDPTLALQLSWYNDTRGGSVHQSTVQLPVEQEWQTSRIDVRVPRNTVAVLPIIRLAPPADEVSQVAVDNVELVDWDEPGCDYVRSGQTVTATSLPGSAAEADPEDITDVVEARSLPMPAPVRVPPGPPAAGYAE